MRALITGAGGFVGRHLREHLVACGDEVIATDRALGGPDLLDPEALGNFVASAAPEAIYHLAGDSDVGRSWNHPAETFRVNAEGTLNVLAAAKRAGVRRVLNVGSADVYGRVDASLLPLDESCPMRPVSPYAASKVAADYLALQATLGHGLDVIRVRAFNHIGPGQSEQFVAPAVGVRIARNELLGEDVVPVGNLTPRRDLTDVRDVVRAYRLLMSSGAAGDVYNVCSGRALSIAEVCEQLIGLALRPMHLESDPSLQRPVDLPVLVGDHSKLTAATGWVPLIPLSTTLVDLMADCRDRVARNTPGTAPGGLGPSHATVE